MTDEERMAMIERLHREAMLKKMKERAATPPPPEAAPHKEEEGPSLYHQLAVGGWLGTSAKNTAEKEGDTGLMGRFKKALTEKYKYEK